MGCPAACNAGQLVPFTNLASLTAGEDLTGLRWRRAAIKPVKQKVCKRWLRNGTAVSLQVCRY
jgi:hypothetical protein